MVFKMDNYYISKSKTDLPIMKPFIIRESYYGNLSKWLVQFSPGIFIFLTLIAIFWPFFSFGQNNYTIKTAFDALIKWIPFLFLGGFLFNILISLFAMLFGTSAGAILGLGQISQLYIIRKISWFFTQLFRNSPWLVILFIVLLAFPFEVIIFGYIILQSNKDVFKT